MHRLETTLVPRTFGSNGGSKRHGVNAKRIVSVNNSQTVAELLPRKINLSLKSSASRALVIRSYHQPVCKAISFQADDETRPPR
jgi:hypothetical protein